MSEYLISHTNFNFNGEIPIPPDKSISHRAVILSTFNKEMTKINNLLLSDDVKTTMYSVGSIGVMFAENNGKIFTRGTGIREYIQSPETIDCRNSGTTARLLIGLLSGQKFSTRLDGDESLKKRPMDRVKEPLEEIGAKIETNNGRMPVDIFPSVINGGTINLSTPSAQVKSAVILAALSGNSELKINIEKVTRDHTEIMLNYFTENIIIEQDSLTIIPDPKIINDQIEVPNDPSSAAFFIVGALINDNSDILLKNICINPTRIKFIDILKNMGANILMNNERNVSGELVADINVKSSDLKGIEVSESEIPLIIDEIPILSLAMSLAEGESNIYGATELRFKESDRINTIISELSKLGANISENNDNIKIVGKEVLTYGEVDSHDDHRIAMMLTIASTKCIKDVKILNSGCVKISFPQFYEIFEKYGRNS
ncbi:3-phosphoshikimate 1-carboxyvinyltransferase [bacterium]|nr:3-phosphoshikimate 1-carboxyvinyltransferase [bacterium]